MAYQSIKNLKAEDVMTKDVISASEEDKLSDVLAKLKKFDIHELPVVRKKRLVGMVSYDTIGAGRSEVQRNPIAIRGLGLPAR